MRPLGRRSPSFAFLARTGPDGSPRTALVLQGAVTTIVVDGAVTTTVVGGAVTVIVVGGGGGWKQLPLHQVVKENWPGQVAIGCNVSMTHDDLLYLVLTLAPLEHPDANWSPGIYGRPAFWLRDHPNGRLEIITNSVLTSDNIFAQAIIIVPGTLYSFTGGQGASGFLYDLSQIFAPGSTMP